MAQFFIVSSKAKDELLKMQFVSSSALCDSLLNIANAKPSDELS